MKRRRLLITGVLLLLGGAIVNVAVAWGCLFADVGFSFGERVLSEKELSWLAAHGEQAWVEADGAPATVSQTFTFGFRSDRISLESPTDREFLETWKGSFITFAYSPNVTIYRSGVPFYSLTAVHWQHTEEWMARHSTEEWDEYTGSIKFNVFDEQWILPVTPIWPGFAINTIFYAAMLWVGFFVPGMVRRRIRRRRGLCPACAYPIGTSPVCTECGKAMKARVLT